ncbi:hypothetical protein GOBAR_DD19046 [Gossypium barbadense]|nr:hypothetical protein GOBAR_DD19046 [Gossypium barbadense]
MDEFKQWLKKFDADNDGRISKEEFLSAIYETGGQFAWCKSRRAIKSADAEGSGFVALEEKRPISDVEEPLIPLGFVGALLKKRV